MAGDGLGRSPTGENPTPWDTTLSILAIFNSKLPQHEAQARLSIPITSAEVLCKPPEKNASAPGDNVYRFRAPSIARRIRLRSISANSGAR